jgi:hypothetical protein
LEQAQIQDVFQNFIWAHFLLRKKPGFPGVPVVNPLRGFTSGVLPEAKLHTGYKPWIQAPIQSLAQIPAPQGVDIIPMIDSLATDFRRF